MIKLLLCFLTVMIVASLLLVDKPELPIENGSLKIYFCPRDDCEAALIQFLDSAQESIHCALFDIGLKTVQEKLKEKSTEIEVKAVTDEEYYHKFSEPFVKKDSFGLMHNKFCITDHRQVVTGSTNPTFNDAHKNNNNLLIIDSTYLAENYEDEFNELWSGEFKKGKTVKYQEIELSGIKIKNYFCPEDRCIGQVVDELKLAEKSIHFMTFSFTSEDIANVLLIKNLEGIEVKGIMEAKQISEHSQYERLLSNGVAVIKDSSPNNMHHKVFIIDGKTVITGSFNPTTGGNTRNDENILIIHDREIAEKFLNEFQQLYVLHNKL